MDETTTPGESGLNSVPAPPVLPVLQAACSMFQSVYPHHPHLTLEDMVRDLQATLHQEKAGDLDLVLVTQVRVMDSMFNHVALTASAQGKMQDRRMDEALRLQRQCRQTIEALRRIEQKSGRLFRSYTWPAVPFPDPEETRKDNELENLLRSAQAEIDAYDSKEKILSMKNDKEKFHTERSVKET